MKRAATDAMRGRVLAGNASAGGTSSFLRPAGGRPLDRPSYTLPQPHSRRGICSSTAAWLHSHRHSRPTFSRTSLSSGRGPSLLAFGSSVAWARTAAVAGWPTTASGPERGNTRSYASMHEMYSKDLYHILGIKDAATQEEIKVAFYKKAKEYHPDMNKENPNAQKKFVEATSAYEILRDTKKRQEYDGMRRTRTSSSSTYTSYTHQSDYANYGAGSARAGRGRADDFTAYGMGHEDFTRWYQQRSDIFNDFEKMFNDIAERMSKKMRARWYQMCENGEVDFEDIYDIYGRMQRTRRKAKKREDRRRKKMEERRRRASAQTQWDSSANPSGRGGGSGGGQKERKEKSERKETKNEARSGKSESDAERGTKGRKREERSEEAGHQQTKGEGASTRRRRSRARKDYYWGKWGRKHAKAAPGETSQGQESNGRSGRGGTSAREQKASEDAKRKERKWQKKKEEIRRRWKGFYDTDTIIFF